MRESVQRHGPYFGWGLGTPDLFSAVFPASVALCSLVFTRYLLNEHRNHLTIKLMMWSNSFLIWAMGLLAVFIVPLCTLGLTIFLPSFCSVGYRWECISEFSLGELWEGSQDVVWGAYESTEPTPSIMRPIPGNCPPFPMAFSTWSRVLLVVDSLASSAGGITWENGGREPEEVKKTVSGGMPVRPGWHVGAWLHFSWSLNFSSEVTRGC